jgi:hypothetical protein
MLIAGVSRIERRQPTQAEKPAGQGSEAAFVEKAHLPDGEVGVVEIEGLFARAWELLRGASLRRGETACQSAF